MGYNEITSVRPQDQNKTFHKKIWARMSRNEGSTLVTFLAGDHHFPGVGHINDSQCLEMFKGLKNWNDETTKTMELDSWRSNR